MHLTLVTAPTSEPVTLEEAKTHCRVDFNDDDALLEGHIAAAREYCENFTRRQFVTATYALRMDDLPDEIVLPRPPLASVTSITYVDATGSTQTLSSSLYTVDTYVEPGRIVPAYNATWPSVRGHTNDVVVTFTCGAAVANVPARAKQAILLLVGHWYENREEIGIGNIVTKIPTAADALLHSLSWGSYR
jgi:uncharacterized phiE125 gp8 family phage protein